MYLIADVISYAFHPVVLMLLTAALFSLRFRNNPMLVLQDIAILLAGLIPGLLYIYIKTRRGDFGHYHLTLKEERRAVLPILLAGLAASFGLYFLVHTPVVMMQAILLGIVGGVGAAAITRVWKISFHAAVAMGCAALFQPISPISMWAFVAMGVTVGVSRLIVKHHTLLQVLVGWGYGFATTTALLWLLNS